ncbi:MAG TPA: M20/M25/M40 family metallo-hydrolase [Ktedonobacteraceae bacterium]|nr:M20/M25/M40 family metallo-hydrolase [Ktedonobacteraceae bacterium]
MQNNWYNVMRDYTLRLVRIRSVNSTGGELRVAEEVLHLLRSDGLEKAYTDTGLDPLPNDPYGRANAYAFLRGNSPRTLVLLGHIDTVDTTDYGPLEPWALDPQGLTERLDILTNLAPGLAEDLRIHPDDWMFGRGSADMKSGVAANIAVMRRLAQRSREGSLPLSVVMLAEADEENASAGILQAVNFLLRLREQYRLEYLGVINTDYTTARYPGDPHRYIYAGTIGKLLPSFLIIGRESHVGLPFDGIDANLLAAELIRNLSMNDELCDMVPGQILPFQPGDGEAVAVNERHCWSEYKQITPPPVTLHATDLKTRYDVQLPFMAYFYLNVLTYSTTPGQLLTRLQRIAGAVLEESLRRIDDAEQRWMEAAGNPSPASVFQPRSGSVLTYADLCAALAQQFGQQRLNAELDRAWESCPPGIDERERALHLVRSLWKLSGKAGPAIIIYYSPPYYPHVPPTPCALVDAVQTVAESHPELHLLVQEYYPYISDMSYLRLDPGTNVTALTANIPTWQPGAKSARPGSYSLPLQAIADLGIPVVNLGPYGRGVHQSGEGVLMSYSFGVLPQLIYEVTEQLKGLGGR